MQIRFVVLGRVEADPEYLLIVEANNMAAEIDSETNTIHKFARCFLVPSAAFVQLVNFENEKISNNFKRLLCTGIRTFSGKNLTIMLGCISIQILLLPPESFRL
jgi:hypothetical protein